MVPRGTRMLGRGVERPSGLAEKLPGKHLDYYWS